MGFFSGNGSSIQVGVTTLHAKLTRVRKQARLAENTHSGTSSALYVQVVKDHAWSGSVPWDSTNLPDTTVGLTEGAVATVTFVMGTSGKTEILTNTTVEYLEDIMDNAGDIIRTEISGKGGVLTRAA